MSDVPLKLDKMAMNKKYYCYDCNSELVDNNTWCKICEASIEKLDESYGGLGNYE